jgi:DNA-binding HxlR family transcriptional regulator
MLKNTYETQVCSMARTLEVVGERWTMLILRELFLGIRRFDEIQEDLGIARNVLAARLAKLVDEGVLEKVRPDGRAHAEYRLTDKGLDLWPVLHSLMTWGDLHDPAPGGPPMVVEHRGCGGAVDAHRQCTRCGERLTARDVRAHPGPGAPPEHPLTRRYQERIEQRVAAG